MQKGSQNDAKIDGKMNDFPNFFKKEEKYEIKLPLEREHDFTCSGVFKLHVKSTQNPYKVDARKNDTKSIEHVTNIDPKRALKSMQKSKNNEKRR